MASSKLSPHPSDVTYQQIRLAAEPGMALIKSIDSQQPGTVFLEEEDGQQKCGDLEDEISTVAAVIATTHIDMPSSDAVLTVEGHANKAALRDALVAIDADGWRASLRAMLHEGARIYRAVHQGNTVGVVVAIRLEKEFPSGGAGSLSCETPLSQASGDASSSSSSSSSSSCPDPSDLKAVKAYAKSGEKDAEFMHQLCGHLNYHLRHHRGGRLWEFSALGVEKAFRRRGIGCALVSHALSELASGDGVIIQAEPGMQTMYQRLGFQFDATLESGQTRTVTLKPEWEKGDAWLVSPMMTFTR